MLEGHISDGALLLRSQSAFRTHLPVASNPGKKLDTTEATKTPKCCI